MLTKTKKKIVKIQKSKIFKNGKNGLEIWWIATFPQNLALICVTVSEKTRFTDGRTTDARATALALLTQSTRAKNVRRYGRVSKNYNLKEIHAIGSKLIDAIDGRRPARRRMNSDLITSADSQAELKISIPQKIQSRNHNGYQY